MNAYAQRQRKSAHVGLSLCAVLVLHGLLLWAIQSGLATKFVKIAKAPVEAMLLEEIKPVLPPPPPPPSTPPPPKTAPPPPAYIPPVVVPVNTPPPANAIAAVANKPQPEAPPSPLPSVVSPAPTPQAPSVRTSAVGVHCPKPEYPSGSLRLEEEGKVALSYLVKIDGSVTDVTVVKSSGYKRLDTAAVQQVSQWRFKPSTLDGKPVEQTLTRSFNFSISNDEVPKNSAPVVGC